MYNSFLGVVAVVHLRGGVLFNLCQGSRKVWVEYLPYDCMLRESHYVLRESHYVLRESHYAGASHLVESGLSTR